MSDKTLGNIIIAVIVMLVVFQIGSLITDLFSVVWGLVSGVVVAAVSFFSVRLAKAGGKSSVWFLLPTLLFTIFPAVLIFLQDAPEEAGWIESTINFMPFFIGFVAPVILLLLVYYELRKRILAG